MVNFALAQPNSLCCPSQLLIGDPVNLSRTFSGWISLYLIPTPFERGCTETIESYRGKKVGYDLLVSIPPNLGSDAIINSSLGDPMGYVPTDKHTLKAQNVERIYVIGDATNVPTSKAGSVAHYMSYTVVENIVREIDGHEALPKFDGHSTCFLASGFEKAILLDFNYDVEPLPGKFPFPGIGPFSLLEETLSNHWGKMMFRWVYWNLMMKGLDMPLEPQMNIAGKIRKVP